MEYWDIYDKNKQLTGRKMKRNDWCLKEDEYHLTVLGVIRRPDGKYLITRRVLTKAWAPGWWEVSGGAAQAGESSEEAVRREVLEETGLDVNGCVGGYMFTYHRENPGEGDNYFVDVYRFEKDFKEEDLHLLPDGMHAVVNEEIKAQFDALENRKRWGMFPTIWFECIKHPAGCLKSLILPGLHNPLMTLGPKRKTRHKSCLSFWVSAF